MQKKIRYLFVIFTLFSLSACVETQKSNPAPKPNYYAGRPLLQIDPGGHKALIMDVVFTPDGRYLVSASADKLIRVWDIETGETVRTLRGEIGVGDEGQIYAMALSPDGRWLAAAGFMGSNTKYQDAIRLYDFSTGKLVALLRGHTDVVLSLAFSPDSRYLVSGQGGISNHIALLWDVKSQRGLQVLRGHTDDIYAVAFSPDSKRVVTGSYDHSLRLWQVNNGKLIAILKGHTDKVQSVAFSPKDGNIVSGSWDHSIRIWDGQSGGFIKTLANQGTQVASLSFSPNGRYLLSGVGDGRNNNCHVYSFPNGTELASYNAHDNIVLATAISPDGRWAATAGGSNQEIHIWNLQTRKLKQRLVGVGASIWAVGFSKDGKSLAWGKTSKRVSPSNRGPLEYQISFPTTSRPLGSPKELKTDDNYLRAQNQWREWSLGTSSGKTGKNAILEIRHQNRIQARIERDATNGVAHLSYSFSPNGETIISGGIGGILTAYSRTGKKLGDYIGHTSSIWAVAVSPDGKLLASASHDQTIRLWNLNSHENLLTIFHGNNGEWVAWTPSGYYTASPNGDKMVGWQINRGVNKAADYVSANQVRNHFYRPDIIDNQIKYLGNPPAQQTAKTEFSLERLKTALPPKFTIMEPLNHSTTKDSELKVVLSFKDNPEHLENLVAYVNGSLVGKFRRWAKSEVADKDKQKTITLPLEPGKNKISIVAKNRIGFTTRDLNINFESQDLNKKGTLYLVAVGVSEYQNPANSLNFPAADAQSIHDYFTGEAGKLLYNRVETRLLADGFTRPSAANIKTALNLFKQAKPKDTVILFLAGHGVKEGINYYFLPYDTDVDNLNSLIKWDILQNVLEESQGRRILLVDTCHSGGAYNSRLVKDSSDNNIVVISATDSESVAQEKRSLRHGVFTYALLEGLQGKADILGDDKTITIKELDTYLSSRVSELTNGSQIPVLHAPGGFKDFVFTKLQ